MSHRKLPDRLNIFILKTHSTQGKNKQDFDQRTRKKRDNKQNVFPDGFNFQ